MAHTRHLKSGLHGPFLIAGRRPPGALSRLANIPSPKPWLAYTVAVVATAVATAVHSWLGQLVGQNLPPFITYYPLVMFTALYGGTSPGLFATLLASLTVPYLFLVPIGSLAIAYPADRLALL